MDGLTEPLYLGRLSSCVDVHDVIRLVVIFRSGF